MDRLSHKENKLLDAVRKGDRQVYKEIYLTYYPELCDYIRSYTNDAQAAEDIVQNVLLKFWINRKDLQLHTSLKGFLFKSAYYAFMDAYRKKKRINEKLEAIRYDMVNEISEEDHDITERRLKALKEAVDELPPKCKEVFVLSKFDGLKYKEIAEKLDLSINTVENQIGKAFKTLRSKMRDNRYLNFFISFFDKHST
ncbi:RNA polymerase sigma factor [Gaetbulibacter saemankumensis]|uniref:RNA polymerase sigma factor n=1 Tax=Gaetbulibacter saemankumensis TaxID=311208 RepID=UPI0003F6E59F|nr:RNA polymerase sigma-70 factor [Gaetbulibacter saemankumensis]